jgi:RNA polymerase sigma-70 factor (sigma-E family)
MADRSEFDEFVTARSHRLIRTAYLLTRDWGAAEDLLQDAMAKAWFAWPRLRGEPEPYVRKIITTSFISQSRRRWRSEVPSPTVERLDRSDDIGASDDRDALWRALGRLPPRQRAVVVLRHYEDMSEADVAATLGCSIGTVKSQSAKALGKLRVDTSLATTATTVSGEGSK